MTFISVILSAVTSFITNVISSWGYAGVVILMAIESACIPLPSEIIMPFAGYLASQGQFTLIGLAFAGAFGCLLGSWLAYFVGYYGGRPLILKYGKYILITKHDLKSADRFFKKHGDEASFISRLLPVVRTFISLPAGISRMHFIKFSIYTFLGSFIWSYALAWIGNKFGENWDSLKVYFHGADIIIGVIILAGIVWFFWHKRDAIKSLFKRKKKRKNTKRKKRKHRRF